MVSLAEIVKEYLTASSPLATEISGRIWTPISPKNFKNDSGNGSIVWTQQDIASHPTGATHSPLYAFKCYGGTEKAKAAETVGGLLFDRLNHADEAVASGRIMTANVAGGGGLTKEQDTKFWVHTTLYQLLIEG